MTGPMHKVDDGFCRRLTQIPLARDIIRAICTGLTEIRVVSCEFNIRA